MGNGPPRSSPAPSRSLDFINLRTLKIGALVLALLWFSWTYCLSGLSTEFKGPAKSFVPLGRHCANASPISSSEFHQRQTVLARTLDALNASAYIAEPGASAQFYGNISLSHWFLSERPLLLIISPKVDGEDIQPMVSVLTPQFEATRAKMLPIPASPIQFVEWAEDANPYNITALVLPEEGTIFVDGSIRNFIVEGLQKALPKYKVSSAPEKITQLRECKSPAELELLKCANEATLLAIRDVHKQMYIGIRESEARKLMATALSSAGLKEGDCLTLFGENAALPHGSGTDRALGKSDFALFDCSGSLHGYYSDVTRTVALTDSDIPEEHCRIWNYVHSSQTIASATAHKGVLTRKVDEAARLFLKIAGYGSYFTHRLGHGIGLELHEEPYLRGGSNDVIETGHTFSNEPGIYIEGKVGVRLEDCFYIDKDGNSVFLTAGVGGQSKSPWFP